MAGAALVAVGGGGAARGGAVNGGGAGGKGREGAPRPQSETGRAVWPRGRFGSGLTAVVPEGEKERERGRPGLDGRQRRGGAARLRPLCRHAARDKRLRAGSAPSGWCAPPMPALLHCPSTCLCTSEWN